MAVAVTLGALCTASAARAQAVVAADARAAIYEDTDATRIITTTVAATVSPVEQLTIGGHYLADVVSSASVDVIAAATSRWEETRNEGLGSLGYKDADRAVSGAYIYSVENDWRSHTASAAFSHDLLNHQLTLGMTGAFGYNEVGRSGDKNFDERMLTGSVNGEAAIVASADDLFAITYSFNYVSGYQESPYRYVRFAGPLSGASLAVAERVPDTRARNAVGLRWNRHLAGHTYLRSQGRAYLDNWGVTSGTLGVELVQGFIDALEIGVFARGYVQKAAQFYEADYAEERTFMTSDRELATFADAFGGLRFGFDVRNAGPFYAIRGDLKGSTFLFHYFDFPALTDRYGVLGELGLGASL